MLTVVECVSIKTRGVADWEVIPLDFLIARLEGAYVTLFLVFI